MKDRGPFIWLPIVIIAGLIMWSVAIWVVWQIARSCFG
jgi:hypothetical protein